jgi:protein-disulfide isomerase
MQRDVNTPSLVVPVDRDEWISGPANAPVTLVEYSDFECSDAARLEPMVQEVRRLAKLIIFPQNIRTGKMHLKL